MLIDVSKKGDSYEVTPDVKVEPGYELSSFYGWTDRTEGYDVCYFDFIEAPSEAPEYIIKAVGEYDSFDRIITLSFEKIKVVTYESNDPGSFTLNDRHYESGLPR